MKNQMPSSWPVELGPVICAVEARPNFMRMITGLQEETTALEAPCLTMRENTECPITVEQGTNTMVGRDIEAIRHHAAEVLAGRSKSGRVPEFWDVHTAERIAADIAGWLIENQGRR